MIYTVKHLMEPHICRKFIEYMEAHPENRRASETLGAQKFAGLDMDPCSIEDIGLVQALEVTKSRLIAYISKLYHTNEVYLDYWDLVKWPEGESMEFHADAVRPDLTDHDYCGWRTYSVILYLNQDYEGGETVFRDMNQNYRGETGKGLIFPATYDYTHGVNEVAKGTRYTIALWFTDHPSKCIKGWELT